jgi:uncharacterized repeat protein (TIGR03803 family)
MTVDVRCGHCRGRLYRLLGLVVVLVAVPARGATLTTLRSFDGTNGASPFAGLTADAAGNLYGSTQQGGPDGQGTIYRLAAGTFAFSTVVSFSGTNGANPSAMLLRDPAGNLYGTTQQGGSGNAGTVFRLNPATNSLTTLVNFNETTGRYPSARLTADVAGNLYGTTERGGPSDYGTVFRVANGTNALTTLAIFNLNNGAYPQSPLLIDAAGNIRGTAEQGGSSGRGTVFQIAAGTGVLSTLATFTGAHGQDPTGDLVADAAGNLYGTTTYGGASESGTVFKFTAGTSALSTVRSFSAASGAFPYGGLIADAAGNLYGTTQFGGSGGSGTVFRIAAGTNAYTTLFTFTEATGANPSAGLIADAVGNLYGTTFSSGPGGAGTAFRLTNTGFVVPEPGSLALLGIGGMSLLRRQRA